MSASVVSAAQDGFSSLPILSFPWKKKKNSTRKHQNIFLINEWRLNMPSM